MINKKLQSFNVYLNKNDINQANERLYQIKQINKLKTLTLKIKDPKLPEKKSISTKKQLDLSNDQITLPVFNPKIYIQSQNKKPTNKKQISTPAITNEQFKRNHNFTSNQKDFTKIKNTLQIFAQEEIFYNRRKLKDIIKLQKKNQNEPKSRNIQQFQSDDLKIEKIKPRKIVLKNLKKQNNLLQNDLSQISIKSKQLDQVKFKFFQLKNQSSLIETCERQILEIGKNDQLIQINQSSSGEQNLIKIDVISQADVSFNEVIFLNQKPGNKRWIQGDVIGSGQFGIVYKSFDLQKQKMIVIKQISLEEDTDGQLQSSFQVNYQIQRELDINKKLDHENIIKYQNYEIVNKQLYIQMEYMSCGSIAQLIEKNGRFPEKIIKQYAIQILHGIDYLHQNKIIHKDLKGANILVNEKEQIKLSDFGFSIQIEKSLTSSFHEKFDDVLKGSIPWMAPEVINQTKCGRKSDIWSFGCTLLEMASGNNPWHEYNFDNPFAAILKIGIQDEIPKIPDDISNELFDLIKQCLNRNYDERPTAKSLFNHPFLI